MKFHMLGRLLKRLQQAVESLRREHVDLVDDIDLVARRDRPVAHLLDDLANVVDAGMGGGVHLDHVDMAAFHDRLAMFAGDLEIDRRLVDFGGLVVERARQNAGRGRLAHSAHAGQHVGLRDASGLEGVGEGSHHRLLANHQVGEILGAIFAGENPVAGRATLGSRCFRLEIAHRPCQRHWKTRIRVRPGQRHGRPNKTEGGRLAR